MGKSQRDKGKAGERELSHTLNAMQLPGPQFRRGRQYAGHPDAPDVVGGPPNLHWECNGSIWLRRDALKRNGENWQWSAVDGDYACGSSHSRPAAAIAMLRAYREASDE